MLLSASMSGVLGAVPTTLDLALMKQLVTDLGRNEAISPYVMSTLMTQAWLGANGTTRTEVRR